jgi:hypothetical protein
MGKVIQKNLNLCLGFSSEKMGRFPLTEHATHSFEYASPFYGE